MCSRVPLKSGKIDNFQSFLATWPFHKLPLPLVAFRDLLADPLPSPNWLRGFWMPPYGKVQQKYPILNILIFNMLLNGLQE